MTGSMFLEKVKSEGLAHLSYVVGHGGQAAVIDPRRDCEIYVEIAHRNGARITHIFETHRNEDYVIGSRDLARRTGAEIYHGKNLDFAYGRPVAEGDAFELGDIRLTVLETPGHTFESISIALADMSFGPRPIAVFTGDCLFIGAVGRTDFFPDRAREVAGLQYDSIFQKILPLGDQVILHPAHGAGSVCGSGMADREFSTLGFERMFNPDLQAGNREDFIAKKLQERPYQPPYFRKMAVGAVAVAGCSVVPDKWTTPLAEFAVLPAHAATSGYAADPPFTTTEVIEKSGVISIDKVLRPKFVSPKMGWDYGSSMKIVFDTGGVIHVPNTSHDVITKEQRIYRTGGRRPDIPTMEVYAEPRSKATKIIIHFMG